MNKYYEEKLKELRLMDDDFMNIALNENKLAVERIIEIIIGNKIKLEEVHTQEKLQNLVGNSVILDIYAKDEKGNQYNIEMQRQMKGAHPKRLRYNLAMIDARTSFKGYEGLKEVYSICITEKDYFKENKGKYKIIEKIEEINKKYYDGIYRIYVNLGYEGEDEIGDLVHDLKEKEAKNMRIRELRQTVERLKNTKEGQEKMCKVFEEIREKGRQEGRKEVELKERELVSNMYVSGLTIEMIARIANISIDKTKKILNLV